MAEEVTLEKLAQKIDGGFTRTNKKIDLKMDKLTLTMARKELQDLDRRLKLIEQKLGIA